MIVIYTPQFGIPQAVENGQSLWPYWDDHSEVFELRELSASIWMVPGTFEHEFA